MKRRRYVIDRNGITVRMPLTTALISWKPLAALAVIFMVLAAILVFVAILAIKILAFVAIVWIILYLWLRLKRFFRDGINRDSRSIDT